MAALDDALDIAQALADLEVEYDIPMNNPLHQKLLAGLRTHADTLGIDEDGIEQIKAISSATPEKPGAVHTRADGTPKDENPGG